MTTLFTAYDASQLSDEWYGEALPGLENDERDAIKTAALEEFANYRDAFKTYPEWCDCLENTRTQWPSAITGPNNS
jgi:hypothetical protein